MPGTFTEISSLWLASAGNCSVCSCLVTVLCLKFVLFLVVVLAHEIFPYMFTILSSARDLRGPCCKFEEFFSLHRSLPSGTLLRQLLSMSTPLNFDHRLLNFDPWALLLFPLPPRHHLFLPLGRKPGDKRAQPFYPLFPRIAFFCFLLSNAIISFICLGLYLLVVIEQCFRLLRPLQPNNTD